jgi:hypothetical protein
MYVVLLMICTALLTYSQDTRALPSWLTLNGEYRVRVEGFASERFHRGADDTYALGRLRLIAGIKPSKWFRIALQGQDARAAFKTRKPYAPPLQDRVDLRWAFIDLGDTEHDGVSLRAGRQTLSFGGGRLVGDPNWSNVGRTFDAVRGIFRHGGGVRVDTFLSSSHPS